MENNDDDADDDDDDVGNWNRMQKCGCAQVPGHCLKAKPNARTKQSERFGIKRVSGDAAGDTEENTTRETIS
eukprot:2708237-Pyramimonas_sp.AAC.1